MNVKTKISALIDGELDAHGLRETFAALRHDEEMRRACTTYLLIGDAMRNELCLDTELTGAVLDHLADEPIAFAPRGLLGNLRDRAAWQRPALALAATVAGVAVVAWLGLPASGPRNTQIAVAEPQSAMQEVNAVANVDASDMQEYLIAHQIHSGSLYLNSETQHIRTVALNGVEAR